MNVEDQLKAVIKDQWRALKQEIIDHMGDFVSATEDEKHLLEAFLNEIDNDTMLNNNERVFNTIKTISNIENQIGLMYLPSLPTKGAMQIGANKIQSWFNSLKKLSIHLWQYLSQHTNLDQWSVTGETGVSLFGLSGVINASLVFKKQHTHQLTQPKHFSSKNTHP